MPIYSYVKERPQPHRRLFSFISTIFVFSGLSLIGWVAYPIIAFELFYAPRFISIIRPIPETILAEAMENRLIRVKHTGQTVEAAVDYTRASTWFPKASPQHLDSKVTGYTISIPKLNIKEADVRVGSEDLSKSLIQWGGTALPGDYGNSVIFGHSTLVWLYNPKNYYTIFSKLPDLNYGDELFFTVDHVTYKYKVEEMRVVSPEDVSVLEQKYDDSYVSLITCVPQGTYLKRLIVKARQIKY